LTTDVEWVTAKSMCEKHSIRWEPMRKKLLESDIPHKYEATAGRDGRTFKMLLIPAYSVDVFLAMRPKKYKKPGVGKKQQPCVLRIRSSS